MTAEHAAKRLDEQLRGYPWYMSVGVGATPEGETIFVYVKSARHRELNNCSKGWMGYRVLVRAVGSIRSISNRGPSRSKFPHHRPQHGAPAAGGN
jgi:hypothetical protein